jgi:hypothetical protein
MKETLLAVAATLLVLTLGEVAVRIWPPTNLDFENYDPTDRFSYLYHHKPKGMQDVRLLTLREDACRQGSQPLSILLLGDSWMQDSEGIPRGLADHLESALDPCHCIQLENAGGASYSPSLLLLKGEQEIRRRKPDLVIVNVDETDLMDESIRYRASTLRDAEGRIERVVPDLLAQLWPYGHYALREQPSHLLRWAERVYFRKVFFPRVARLHAGREGEPSYQEILAPQRSADPRRSHGEEIAYFESVLGEMLDRLAAAMGGPQRVGLTHHPHYLQLVAASDPAHYNTVVSETLARQSASRGIVFYDAQPEIQEIYQGEFARYFQWPDDPFSHLTLEGSRRYGRFIGRAFAEPILRTAAEKRCAADGPER